jgi:hypothetical protein
LKEPAAVTLWAVYYLGPGDAFRRFCFPGKGGAMKRFKEILTSPNAKVFVRRNTDFSRSEIFKNDFVAKVVASDETSAELELNTLDEIYDLVKNYKVEIVIHT